MDGLRLHARVALASAPSNAPVLVLVHGLGVSSRYMAPLSLRLAAHYRIYVPDLPGFGLSEHPRHAFDVPRLADALGDWLDCLDSGPVTFLAHSFGCQVVADLVAREPKRAEHLILASPMIDATRRGAYAQGVRLFSDAAREPLSLLAIALLDYQRAGWFRVQRTFRYALRDRIEEKLPEITQRVLVVRGARDPIVTQRWAEQVTAMLPRGRLVLVPGAAHAVNYAAPDALAREVRRFLAE